jgi:hypothetical protein
MRLRLALVLAATLPCAAGDWTPEQKDVQIPMRDGKSLAADVYLPAAEGRYPAVLIQTPYNKRNMGTVMTLDSVPAGETGRGSTSDMKVLMDRERYAYVVLDWRGFYGSKAAMEGVRKLQWRRGQDGYDAVEWIAAQPWSDGKVGTWGGSALGKQQLDTAAEHPPHLTCCVPLIAAMGQWYESYFEGGILLEGHVKRLDQLGFGVGEMVKGNRLSGTPLWLAAERISYRPSAIEVPCLFVTGWWDNYPDRIIRCFEDVVAKGGEQARAHSKLLIGPWDHVGIGVAEQGDLKFEKASLESARAAKAFFDRWLRGVKDNGWEGSPRVRYWTVNEQEWKGVEAWSKIPRRTAVRFLHADGRILAAKPEQGGIRAWTCDPTDPSPTLGGANLPPMKHGPLDQSALSARKDGVWYSTGKLDKPLRVNGNVELTFTFTANRPDCDFTARLCEAGADGRPILMADAAGRAKLRDGTGAAKLLASGEKHTITLRFPAAAITFPEGHELRLYLSSSNWPRYERNSHTGADDWDPKAAQPVEVTVDHAEAELWLPCAE